MNCDDDYVNKPEKYKCLENTIDGSIFNKHNDQEKTTLVKRIFFTCMEFSREASDAGEFFLKTKSRDFRVIFYEK